MCRRLLFLLLTRSDGHLLLLSAGGPSPCVAVPPLSRLASVRQPLGSMSIEELEAELARRKGSGTTSA